MAGDRKTCGVETVTGTCDMPAGHEGEHDDRPLYPCGCVVCRCEDEERCHGCGAKFCANHSPATPPPAAPGPHAHNCASVIGGKSKCDCRAAPGPGTGELPSTHRCDGRLVHGSALDCARCDLAAALARAEKAEAERDEARREAERLRVYEPRLKNFAHDAEKNETTATVKAPCAQDVALHFAEVLMHEGAPNYAEVKVSHPEHGAFAVTVQRCAGKTPHEFRAAAEASLLALRERVRGLAEALDKSEAAAVAEAKRMRRTHRAWWTGFADATGNCAAKVRAAIGDDGTGTGNEGGAR